MKHTLSVILAVMALLGYSVVAMADPMSTTKDISLSLGVNDAFGFEVWDTELSQTLDSIIPGETAFADIHIYATSNHTVPWTINASSSGLIGTTQGSPDTIPVKIATYGKNLTGATVTDLLLTETPQPIYTAGAGEYPAKGLEISALCIIEAGGGTKQDWYEGIVALTMTQ